MNRQAIAISLNDLDKMKEIINETLDDIKKTVGIKKEENTRVQFNIVNFQTVKGETREKVYCSDTWEFEDLIPESRKSSIQVRNVNGGKNERTS